MKQRILLITFCLLVINNQLVPKTPISTPIEMHPCNNPNLKVLSWNIYMLPFVSLFNKNGTRAKVIADQIQNSDYQIVVFQEAFSTKCRRILANNLRAQYPYQYGPVNNTHMPFTTNSGLWIVSKIPLIQLGQIQFSCCRGFDGIARKGAVLFQGEFQNSNFQILATHLQADNAHEIRTQQCAEIKEKLLNAYSDKNTPQFICGDFNIDMDDSPNYTEMLKTLDAQNGELSGNLNVTYDEIDNNLARIEKGKKRILDYVLTRNNKRIRRIERKVQPFMASIDGKETYLSDHYAMEFIVNFTPSVATPPELQLALEN